MAEQEKQVCGNCLYTYRQKSQLEKSHLEVKARLRKKDRVIKGLQEQLRQKDERNELLLKNAAISLCLDNSKMQKVIKVAVISLPPIRNPLNQSAACQSISC